MYSFTRSQARLFRAVIRLAGIGKRIANPRDKLSLVSDGGQQMLCASSGAVVVQMALGKGRGPNLSLPMQTLVTCEGRSQEAVIVEKTASDYVEAKWTDRSVPQSAGFRFEEADPMAAAPQVDAIATNDPGLWQALADAVATVDPDATRYAINCLQLRGGRGEIVATDAHQVLIHGGFTFPFQDDVLIPGNRVLGFRDLPRDQPVLVGFTNDWLAISVDPWRILLKVEKERRFPRVDDVIPYPARDAARLILAGEDANFLEQTLPKLPGHDDIDRPVTVDLNGHIAIRSKSAEQARPTEVMLLNSLREGEPIRIQTNRNYLVRAIRLGFREVCFTDPKSPALCDDGRRRFLWALLGPEGAVTAESNPIRFASVIAEPEAASALRPQPITPRTQPVTATKLTPKPAAEDAPTPRTSAIEQLITVRDTLRTALSQANEALRAIKGQKREARLVQSTLASLRQLQDISA